ncbi:glycosyltransferase [Paenibacillus soyae]|uniref:Glycosyltransferase n=1 Tax=Paenibacillus soyae TaxID=2969249 RepID=A0A9X2MRC8_9BACL|nr:glycosyltransferase [Paenibacillus soyae]MCR2802512.1 glycosyltransferase [Paenibacillus soyae]
MKQNLLFVMPSLDAGGGERSLVNLLSHIDYDRFNVDLFLLSHKGLFLELLPKEVNVLPLPQSFQTFSLSLTSSLKRFLSHGQPHLAISRLLYALRNRSLQNIARREQASWQYLANALEQLNKKYDAAIGYLEKTSIYFCVDKVIASNKIGWVHTDYDKMGMDPEFDRKYFEQLDHIITVSEECANVLKGRFPAQEPKVQVIYNIVSPTLIKKMAAVEKNDVYSRVKDQIVILSIGRLHPDKNFGLAISACKLLLDQGYDVQWNIIGEGEEREELQKRISEEGIGAHFKLLGLKSNPYPYLQQADIYVQTSCYEGKSIAIDEAKILHKPIVITNFSTARDQITDGVDGLIAEMNPLGLSEAVAAIIEDQRLKKRLSEQLSILNLGTESEIHKLYQVIG